MRAVLFDLFGTLVDNATVEQFDALHREVAAVLQVPYEEFVAGWKGTLHDRSQGKHVSVADSIVMAALKCNIPYDETALSRATEIRFEFTRQWLTPRADAACTLSQFRDRGIKTGLLSNCSAEVPLIWPSLILAPLIDEPLFSCWEGMRKPMAEFYERAMTRLGVAASECLYVADGDNGELAQARALGMPTIMIRPAGLINDYRTNPEDDWEGPKIERLSDLLPLLDSY